MSGVVFVVLALAPSLRYDLRAGDRIVYRQTLEQVARSASVESTVRTEWRNQILVVAEGTEGLAVGFQRQRVRSELLRYREQGKDRLAQEQAAFADRVAQRPAVFAEAGLLQPNGWSRLPWSAVREAGGELLPFIRELPALPLEMAADGTWRGDDDILFKFRLTGREPADAPGCLEVEGRAPQDSVRLRYSFCPNEGLVRRLEMTGEYDASPGRRVSETLTLELLERRRGEDIPRWLGEPEVRVGVLAALLACAELPRGVDAEALHALLAIDDPKVQRRALVVLHRYSLPPPPASRREALLASPDPRVRALAARLSAPRPTPSGEKDERCEPGWAEAALRARRLAAPPPGDGLRHIASGDHAGRLYVLHVPEDYRGDEPFPLLIVLGGGPGNALLTAQGTHEVIDPTGYLVVYPHAYGYWWDEQTAAAVRALLQELLAQLNVDVNRVYLTGFSNGGTGTFLYATRWPDRLAAAAPLMGAGIAFFPEEEPLVANLTRLPLLFIHGDRDEVITVRGTQDTVKAIRRRRKEAPVEEVILPGRGHDVRLRTDDGRTLAFFEGRRRDPFPREVTLEARAAGARSYWVAIAEKEGGVASVEGAIDADNTVRLTTRRVKRVRLLLRRELLPGPGPLRVLINGREAWQGPAADDCRLLQESWRATGDPFLAHGLELTLDVPR